MRDGLTSIASGRDERLSDHSCQTRMGFSHPYKTSNISQESNLFLPPQRSLHALTDEDDVQVKSPDVDGIQFAILSLPDQSSRGCSFVG